MTGNNKQSKETPHEERESKRERERRNGKRYEEWKTRGSERERERGVCLLSPSLLTTQEKVVYNTKYSHPTTRFFLRQRFRPNFRFLYRNRESFRLIRFDPREIIRRLGGGEVNLPMRLHCLRCMLTLIMPLQEGNSYTVKMIHELIFNLILFSPWQHHFEKRGLTCVYVSDCHLTVAASEDLL